MQDDLLLQRDRPPANFPFRRFCAGKKYKRLRKESFLKTDTKLHDNCQRRPRTFVVMVRQDGNKTGAPLLGFENIKTSILDCQI